MHIIIHMHTDWHVQQLLNVSSGVHKAKPCTGMEQSESFDNVK